MSSSRRLAAVLAVSAGIAFGAAAPARAQSDAPAEVYYFNTLGMGGDSVDSFVDRFAGSDLLPYTADDFELPERGNIGGTWGASHLDTDSDGVVDGDEHIFVVIRRNDDDTFSFAANSHPEYGVIYEAEDWIDYHEARNRGPSATLAGDLDAEGNDFEHNDRPGWEGQCNAILYNHLEANQHGEGKPRYYFELRNPSNPPGEPGSFVYDEIEGFEKPLNFQHNLDDPTTAFNERGNSRRDYMRTRKAVSRGYLIPVEHLAILQHGDLPTLFGWETVDLADYLRGTILPRLGSPDLNIFIPDVADPSIALPPTHLMLLQIEAPIDVNIDSSCASQADAEAMASYWGLSPEGATYRVSHLLGFNAELTAATHGESLRRWVDHPEDGAKRNLWLLDHFFRDDPNHLGRYAFEGPAGTVWPIVDDPAFAVIDQTKNRALSPGGEGAVVAPLPRAIGLNELPFEVVADLATSGETSLFQVALRSAGQVVAYADISKTATAVSLGGAIDPATGKASGGAAGPAGARAQPGDFGAGEFTRYVLRVDQEAITLSEAPFNDYAPSDFSGLAGLQVLARRPLAGELQTGFDAVSVYAGGPAGISTIAAFAGFPRAAPAGAGPFVRGDCNGDGRVTGQVTDAVFLLNFNFTGGNPPPCRAACDANGDGAVLGQVTDAVYILNFNFLGGRAPPAPFPGCGRSTAAGDLVLGCATATVRCP